MHFILATNPNGSSGLTEAQNPENSIAGKSLNYHLASVTILDVYSSIYSFLLSFDFYTSCTLLQAAFQFGVVFHHPPLSSCHCFSLKATESLHLVQSPSRLPCYFHSSLFSSTSDFCSSSDSICTTRSIIGSPAVCVLICLSTFALWAFETSLKVFLLC